MARQLLNVHEIAELTGFAEYTLYEMAKSGRIPAIRVGRNVRFDRTAVEKWLDKLPKASA